MLNILVDSGDGWLLKLVKITRLLNNIHSSLPAEQMSISSFEEKACVYNSSYFSNA